MSLSPLVTLVTIVAIGSCLATAPLREALDTDLEEGDTLYTPVKRGNYDYWRGFGSDGYAGLYDFVKRAPSVSYYNYGRNYGRNDGRNGQYYRQPQYYGDTQYYYRDPQPVRNTQYFRPDPKPATKKSKYNYWEGFGSDGYLYDFVKK